MLMVCRRDIAAAHDLPSDQCPACELEEARERIAELEMELINARNENIVHYTEGVAEGWSWGLEEAIEKIRGMYKESDNVDRA